MSIKYLDGTNQNHPEAKRLVSWYGDRITHFGGGNESGRKPDQNFLWKPKADNGGNLVVLTPSGLRVDSVRVGIEKAVNMSIGNGWRPHWRFSRPGSAYGSNVQVVLSIAGGGAHVVTVPNGGARYQTASLPKGSTAAPTPSQPAPAPVPAIGGSITFPASYAARVGMVALVGGKGELCTPDPRVPGRWTHKRCLEPRDFYAIQWKEMPPRYAKAYNLGPAGVWSYFDDGDFQAWPNKQVPVSPVPPPAIPLPTAPVEPAPLYTRTDTSLTLRPDFAAVVTRVDALTNVTHGKDAESIKIPAVRTGNTWALWWGCFGRRRREPRRHRRATEMQSFRATPTSETSTPS